jgi:4a-hydroxytetrahydrobiopterin dehydratase
MSKKLENKVCTACEEGDEPMPDSEAEEMLKEIPGWEIVEGGEKIRREYKLDDFQTSMDLVNNVAEIAEQERHHPDIYIWYDTVRLDLTTHEVGGLTENDFIVAAKINTLEK